MSTHTFSIRLNSPKQSRAIFDALSPETGASYERKAKTSVQVKNDRLTFTINAMQTQAFESSKDSYTRLVSFARSLIE